jgi:hypothetical protein
LKMVTVGREHGPRDLHFWQYMFPEGMTPLARIP